MRDLVEAHDEAYVVTGALFEGVNRTIGEGVHIPSHLYKAIYIPSLDVMLGFKIPNEPFDIDDLDDVQVKVKKLESNSQLDFFHKLLNAQEKPMEKVRVDYCQVVGQFGLPDDGC